MSKHTPGPWKVKAGSNAVLAGRKQICSHVNAASVLPVNIVEDHKIAEANARLIAAAPELLEALKLYEEAWEHLFAVAGSNGIFTRTGHELNCSKLNEAHHFGEKAIAKATGQ